MHLVPKSRVNSMRLHYIFSCLTLLISLICLAVFYFEMGALSAQLEKTREISEKKSEALKVFKNVIDSQTSMTSVETLSSLTAIVNNSQFIMLDSDNADAAEQAFTKSLRQQLTFFIIVIAIMAIIRSLYVGYFFCNIRKLKRINMIDPLTGVWNRNYLKTIKKTSGSYILAIDFDNFKSINDRWGHAFGDNVLKKCANVIVSQTREDVVIRMGGDEFIVILNNVDASDVWPIAERLLKSVNAIEVTEPSGTVYHPSLSMGLSVLGSDLDASLNVADINLYRSKQRGKGMITG